MKVSCLLTVCVLITYGSCAISDSRVTAEWKTFKTKHKKFYSSKTEESYRKSIFKVNLNTILQHNERYANGETSFKMGVNKFADKLHSEISSSFKGYQRTVGKTKVYSSLVTNSSIPSSVNWVKEGYVTAVKDQGNCGGCWAFSSTGALEGQFYKQSKVLTSLSEQNLIDCSDSYGNEGCNGGLMDYAFSYVQGNGGIDTESSYPFTGVDGTCKYKSSNSAGTDSGFYDLDESESVLKVAVAEIGPISVAIDADHDSFTYYESGVYYESNCSTTDLDHGVLVVGYGTEDSEAYWLVKNSWGTDWGEKGYIKMARNRDNMCGIATEASYPIVTSSDVSESSTSSSKSSGSEESETTSTGAKHNGELSISAFLCLILMKHFPLS